MARARVALVAVPFIVLLAVVALLVTDALHASIDAAEGPTGLLAALRRTPKDATLHEQFALEQARSLASAEEARAALQHAIKALELRPVSPYGWSALAEVKYRGDVADATFQAALQRAAELGAHEPAVQESVTFYGLAVWDEASPVTRTAIDRLLKTGIKRDPAGMMRIAQRRGRLDVACRHVDGALRLPAIWAQLCKQTGGK